MERSAELVGAASKGARMAWSSTDTIGSIPIAAALRKHYPCSLATESHPHGIARGREEEWRRVRGKES